MSAAGSSLHRMGSKTADQISATLAKGEQIIATVDATYAPSGTSGSQRGTLALTDKRILFAGRGGLTMTTSSQAFRLDQVSAVSLTKTLMTAHLVIASMGAQARFLVKYKEAQGFAAQANAQLVL